MILDAGVLILAALYVGLPVLAVVIAGLSGSLALVLGAWSTWHAVIIGIAVSTVATLLAVSGALVLILGRSRFLPRGVVSFIGSLPLAFSPLALGAGLFVLLLRLGGAARSRARPRRPDQWIHGLALCPARRGAGGGGGRGTS